MATKKFVPRGNNEGGLGDSTRRWKNVHAATGSFYNGLSGSLQTLTDGSSYLVEGSNISISSGSNGQVTIAATSSGTMSSFKVTGSHDVSSEVTISDGNTLEVSGSGAVSIVSGQTNAITASLSLDGTSLQQSATGLKVNPNLTLSSLTVDGTVTTIETENLLVRDRFILLASGTTQEAGEPPVQGGIIVASGALGTAQSLIFGASGSMWHATQGDAQNGVITSIPPTAGHPSPYVPLGVSELRLSGSDNKKLTTNGTDIILTSAGNLQLTGTNGIDVKNDTIFRQGLSGSLQTLADGSVYLLAGTNITITTASSGQVTINSTGGGSSASEIWFDEGNSSNQNFIIRPKEVSGSLGLGLNPGSNGDVKTNYGIFLSGSGHAVFNELSKPVDFRIESENSSSMFFVDGSENRIGVGLNTPLSTLHIKESNAAIRIQRSTNANSSSLEFAGSAGHIGSIIHEANGNDLIFSTHNGTTPEEMLRLGSHYVSLNRQIILLSGSGVGTTSMQPKQSADLNFFVSGSIGSRGTSTKGTAVFGGDLHVSGNLTVNGTSPGGSGGSVAADDVTLGDAAANFKTSTGDINISGSNVGITGSNISFFGDDTEALIINGSTDNKYSLQYGNQAITFDQSDPKLSLKSTSTLRLDVNDTIDLFKSSTQKAGSIKLSQDDVEFQDSGNNQTIKYDTESITLSKIVTASNGLSSSLLFFKNNAARPSTEYSSLFSATGSLYWRNPHGNTELKILSGSEGGGAALNGGTNITVAGSDINLDSDVSLTNLTASNAVSSSLYTFKDVGEGTSSNYSNQLYNVTGTLYWDTNHALISGSSTHGLVRDLSKPSAFNSSGNISVDKSNTVVILDITSANVTCSLPSYSGLPTGFYFSTKNKTAATETELKPQSSEYLDGVQNDTIKLQPKASLTFTYSGDSFGWIVE